MSDLSANTFLAYLGKQEYRHPTNLKQMARGMKDPKIRESVKIWSQNTLVHDKQFQEYLSHIFDRYFDRWLVEEPQIAFVALKIILELNQNIKTYEYKYLYKNINIKYTSIRLMLSKNIENIEEFIAYLKPKYLEAKEMNELYEWEVKYIKDNKEVLEALA